MAYHDTYTSEDLHSIVRWTFVSAADRNAAGVYADSDIGKVAWQTDTDTFYLLKSVDSPGETATPTWVMIGASSVTGGGGSVTSLVAGSNITLTNAGGALTIASTGGGGGGSSSYADLILESGPEIYYKLDEAPGASTIVDSSGNERDTTPASGATFGGDPLIKGESATSLILGATGNSFASTLSEPILATDGLTVESVLYVSGLANISLGFVTSGASTSSGVAAGAYINAGSGSGDSRQLQYLDYTAWYAIGYPIPVGISHIAVAVYDSAAHVFVNGQLVKAPFTVAAINQFQSFAGAYRLVGGSSVVRYGHFAAYSRVLRASEIAKHAQRVFSAL